MKINKKKKIYFVKREVLAFNIQEAMTAKGRIYEIHESAQPPEEIKPINGFKGHAAS